MQLRYRRASRYAIPDVLKIMLGQVFFLSDIPREFRHLPSFQSSSINVFLDQLLIVGCLRAIQT